ncbi:hypothetical protein CN078_27055, partial [Sinorhizobium medicae]
MISDRMSAAEFRANREADVTERPSKYRNKKTTVDQGVMDEEGYFTFFGRDDDVITSSGYRIGPGE